MIPSAFASFSSIATVGLIWPFSMRLTVTKPTLARLASSRTEWPRFSLQCRSRTGMHRVLSNETTQVKDRPLWESMETLAR